MADAVQVRSRNRDGGRDVERVVDLVRLEMRMCADKNRYSARLARLMAEQLRARGVPVGAYRCLFHPPAEAAHWHVGHCPSMRGVQEMADAIRQRAGNAPGPQRVVAVAS